MNHVEIKESRQSLGLTLRELADMLDTDAQSVRRMEMDPTHAVTARTPAPRMVRLIRAYLDGYRPEDWPV